MKDGFAGNVGSVGQLGTGSDFQKDVSPIDGAISNLGESVDRLSNCLASLGQRLAPITVAFDTAVPRVNGTAQVSAPISIVEDKLELLKNRVDGMSDAVLQALQELRI